MKKGVMMQGFEWYLPSSPHLWKILRINAFKLKKAGITAIWLPATQNVIKHTHIEIMRILTNTAYCFFVYAFE